MHDLQSKNYLYPPPAIPTENTGKTSTKSLICLVGMYFFVLSPVPNFCLNITYLQFTKISSFSNNILNPTASIMFRKNIIQ